MSRSLPLAALAVALVVAASGCTKAPAGAPGARLRQPASIAAFQGKTIANEAEIRPYFAIANAARNDLTIMDASNDVPVTAPIALRSLQIPIDNRPSLLASASLGDDEPATETTAAVRRADLLVAVIGGDNVVQLVETWNPANTVHDADALAVTLPADVLALVPMPPYVVPGTPPEPRARIAALLAGDRVAVLEYKRSGEAIEVAATTLGPTLAFHPEAIAAMPGDPAGVLYAATRDPIATDGSGNPLYGVVELAPDLSPGKALVAVAPTRLVAAAQLQERQDGSASSGTDAFAGQPTVRRVYAVLEESGCGPAKRIDCGVVALDPARAAGDFGTVTSGALAIPPDYAGLQPHRAPMRVPGHPLQLAISGPPAAALGNVSGEPGYPAGFMRIYMGGIGRATTAVAAVASDDGSVYFLDLGRYETETEAPVVNARTDGTPSSNFGYPPQENPLATVPPTVPRRRLWIRDSDGAFVGASGTAASLAAVTTTPGFTPEETWLLKWEGILSVDLASRLSEVAKDQATSLPALAMQAVDRSGATPVFSHVAKLWHPGLGVREGDIVVIQVGGMPAGCVGTVPLLPPNTVIVPENMFEVRVGALLPPSDAHPGGAITLLAVPQPTATPPAPPPPPDPRITAWQACYDVLANAPDTVSGLRATIRASGLVLTSIKLGYAGRPQLDADYEVKYPFPGATGGAGEPDEAALATACPVADWDGTFPVTNPAFLACDAACRDACEKLVVGRKARRLQNVSVDCRTNTTTAAQSSCFGNWPQADYPFPIVNGPALGFRVGVQPDPSQPESLSDRTVPFRDMLLTFVTKSGATPYAAREPNTSPYEASDAIAFDRTAWTNVATDGYRFLVSYPADFVLDATPSQSGTRVPAAIIK